MHKPHTIRASISNDTLQHVTRFFDATTRSIFAELFQNARRAGATKIRVLVEQNNPTNRNRITVSDNGHGIDDPAILLRYGSSGWIANPTDEDPAGMGFLSLSRHGCTVRSRTPHAAWTMTLAPEHFAGDKPAVVTWFEPDPDLPDGTEITFEHRSAPHIIADLEAAAQYYPLPVHLLHIRHSPLTAKPAVKRCGVLPQRPWKKEQERATHTIDGVAFSIGREHHSLDLNFFGITMDARLPTITTLDGTTWSARADILEPGGLRFTLPARQTPVQNEALTRLQDNARLAILRTIAKLPNPRLAYDDWCTARNLGIHIRQPEPLLKPWVPDTADAFNCRTSNRLETPPDNAILVPLLDPHHAQNLAHALRHANTSLSLYATDNRLQGYPWYDRLLRIYPDHGYMRILSRSTPNSVAVDLANQRDVTTDTIPTPARELTLVLPIFRAGLAFCFLRLKTNLALDTTYPDTLYDCTVYVARPLPDIHDAVQFLVRAIFCPSDDPSADSFETQLQDFRADAFHILADTLLTPPEALRQTLDNLLSEKILPAIPADLALTVTVSPYSRNQVPANRIHINVEATAV